MFHAKKWFAPLFLFIVLCIIFVLYKNHSAAAAPCPEGCNVVLIMVDTLSAKHMDLYGYNRTTMPKTAAFFSKGTVYENAYSAAPWTFASFPSMYFSDLASTVSYKDLQGETTRPSMQSALRDHGVAVRGSLQPEFIFITEAVNMPFKQDERMEAALTNKTNITNTVFSNATKQILSMGEATSSKFFLMVHTFEVHDPYMPADPYSTEFGTTSVGTVTMNDLLKINQDIKDKISTHVDDRAPLALKYDQGLAQLDDILATFLDSIPQETLKNTVIILAADHGEAFGEHELFWHSNSLYEEEMHIPLAIYVPNGEPRRIKEPVSLLDMAPTVLALTGVPIPASFTGSSLLPTLSGNTLGERVLRFENGFPTFLSQEQLKPGVQVSTKLEDAGVLGSANPIILQTDRGVRSGNIALFTNEKQTLLFDLAKDPREKNNLYASATSSSLKTTFTALQKVLESITR